MTTKTRRTFTDEFKREAVALLESSGRPHLPADLPVTLHRHLPDHFPDREPYLPPPARDPAAAEAVATSSGQAALTVTGRICHL